LETPEDTNWTNRVIDNIFF